LRAGLFWRERGRYSAHSSEGLGSGLSLPVLANSPSPGAGLGGSPRDRQVLDIVRYSLPSLLRYEDRNSMGNSIESRLPFLDHRVLEFGVALPTVAKLKGGMGKHVLRQAMRGLVPGEVLFNRDKRGFDTRHGDFIAGGVGSAIRDAMRAHREAARRWIGGADPDRFFADDELAGNASRFAEATTVLWMLDPSLESYPA
jgi:asparagine synthase (glutamine-hydrolysing)